MVRAPHAKDVDFRTPSQTRVCPAMTGVDSRGPGTNFRARIRRANRRRTEPRTGCRSQCARCLGLLGSHRRHVQCRHSRAQRGLGRRHEVLLSAPHRALGRNLPPNRLWNPGGTLPTYPGDRPSGRWVIAPFGLPCEPRLPTRPHSGPRRVPASAIYPPPGDSPA